MVPVLVSGCAAAADSVEAGVVAAAGVEAGAGVATGVGSGAAAACAKAVPFKNSKADSVTSEDDASCRVDTLSECMVLSDVQLRLTPSTVKPAFEYHAAARTLLKVLGK